MGKEFKEKTKYFGGKNKEDYKVFIFMLFF